MKCRHKWEKMGVVLTLRQRLMFWNHYFMHNYSRCLKCGVVRHDIDGDIVSSGDNDK